MISLSSNATARKFHAGSAQPASSFLKGMQAWQNKHVRQAEKHFQLALDNEQLTPDQLNDMGDFFRVTARRNRLAVTCYEKAITAGAASTDPALGNTRVNLSRCCYQQWQKSIFKKPELLQKAGDQMETVLKNTHKPIRNTIDYKLFAEQAYPNPRQAAEVGLRLSKQSANLTEAKSILSHVAAKITTRYQQQPFGTGRTSYLHAKYKPSFAALPEKMREAVAGFLYAHQDTALFESQSEARAALSVIPREQIPLTAARIDADRAARVANQFDQKIFGKYLKG